MTVRQHNVQPGESRNALIFFILFYFILQSTIKADENRTIDLTDGSEKEKKKKIFFLSDVHCRSLKRSIAPERGKADQKAVKLFGQIP